MTTLKLQTLEESVKENTIRRLKAIKGQVDGLQTMVDEGRYCIEILTQLSSIQEALRGVGKIILRNYLENCATSAIRSRREQDAEKIYDELMDVFFKFAK
ncbi:MAG: metal-sensitive transcriptional regulator [Acidobacteria bacterium]|nr:metal-sensitive transcriptional regulator [Acidobacteriota bacterium]